MQVITNGSVYHRTKLMLLERAARFARCLSRNPRFTGVSIETSARAKSDRRHYVQYLPANVERAQAMVDAQQDARAERAATQGFTFVEDADAGQPFCWCHSHSSGETYEVTLFDCSCADFRYRLTGTGIACKHMLALSAAVERGEVARWGEEPADYEEPFGPWEDEPMPAQREELPEPQWDDEPWPGEDEQDETPDPEEERLARARRDRDLLWP